MVSEKAASFFHGPEKYNCCQAVMKAFEEVFDVTEDAILECKAFGGGRAPEGMCGALYATHLMLEDDQSKQNIQAKFLEVAGSTSCREIKKLGTLACKDCVKTAAKFLDEISQ